MKTVLPLAQRVQHYIRRNKLLKAGDRVGIAVSGGADSIASLRLMLELRRELGAVLSVVHFNHKLRGAESDADEQFVAELAARHKLPLHSGNGNASAYAEEKHLSLEAAARALRYEYFLSVLREGHANSIATAHTLDDQAETVLLKLARGAGTRGLAGIYPRLSFRHLQEESFSIVRPLLATRRSELEQYLNALGQSWREDSSNRDLRHARNRVRHGILPRLERGLNPAVREVLAETAEIAHAEEEYWNAEVARIWPQARAASNAGRGHSQPKALAMNVATLAALPLALRRRVLRAAAESLGLRLEYRQVEEILHVAASAGRTGALPNGWVVSCHQNELSFERIASPERVPREYEYPLAVPGCVDVPELDARFEAALVRPDNPPEYNPENLLDPALLAKELKVRNWRAGDRYWPAHTKSARKIKELLQERHISGPERKLWPVIVSGEEVVWVRGFPAPARSRVADGKREAVMIREVER